MYTIFVPVKTQRLLNALSDKEGLILQFKIGIMGGFLDSANYAVKEVQKNIRTGRKTGRIYNIRGRRHQASAWPQSPANLTGKLADETSATVNSWNQFEFGYTTDYGKWLENGTPKRQILPRPNINKVAVTLAPRIEQYTERRVNRLMNNFFG